MPRFLLAHHIASMPTDQEAWIRDWSGLRRRARGPATWTSSWYCSDTNRLYCEWDAPDRDAIEACFTPDEREMAPIVSVEEVVHMDPAWLD
jgi:hypothetical protein